MGVFFTRPVSVSEAARPLLRAAHLAHAKDEAGAAASADADTATIAKQTRPAFSVPRFLCAGVLVVVLFGLYYLSAHDPTLSKHSDDLFNLFQILTTGLTGVLVGEASARG